MSIAGAQEQYIGADTLAYLSIDGLLRSVGNDQSYCMACFDGNYPVPNLN